MPRLLGRWQTIIQFEVVLQDDGKPETRVLKKFTTEIGETRQSRPKSAPSIDVTVDSQDVEYM